MNEGVVVFMMLVSVALIALGIKWLDEGRRW